jgi:Polyketide cyclase / dehydrase and lipid transport
MATSHWHKLYSSSVAAPPAILFELLSDMPNYGRWLPGSTAFAQTTDVEPYPVQRGSRYHDGKPGEPGKDWWGTVTGFQPPGSLDFHHTIHVSQLKATVEVHIHYSFEPEHGGTQVIRWLVLDITMPIVFRPLRPLVIRSFNSENVRTMAAVKKYAEAHGDGLPGTQPAS